MTQNYVRVLYLSAKREGIKVLTHLLCELNKIYCTIIKYTRPQCKCYVKIMKDMKVIVDFNPIN